MGKEHKINDNLTDLENVLCDLSPVPVRWNTAHTLFLAGQQSMRIHQRWLVFWPALSACLALVCIGLATVALRPVEPRIVFVPQIVHVPDATLRDAPVETKATEPSTVADPPAKRSNSLVLGSIVASHVWHAFRELQQQHAQLLSNPFADLQASSVSGDPATITPLRSSDWPSMLSDAGITDQRSPSNTLKRFDWQTLFSTRGS